MKERIDFWWTPVCFAGIVAASIAQPWAQGLVLMGTAGVILGGMWVIEQIANAYRVRRRLRELQRRDAA